MLSFDANEQKRCATHIGSWGPGHTSRGRKLSQATCPPIEARPVTEKCCATSWCAGVFVEALGTNFWTPEASTRVRRCCKDPPVGHLAPGAPLGHPFGGHFGVAEAPYGRLLCRKAPIRCPVLGFIRWMPLLVPLGTFLGESLANPNSKYHIERHVSRSVN